MTCLDTVGTNLYLAHSFAEVAELADAHDSGSCVRKDVEVRVLSSAPGLCRSGPRAHGPAAVSACEHARAL